MQNKRKVNNVSETDAMNYKQLFRDIYLISNAILIVITTNFDSSINLGYRTFKLMNQKQRAISGNQIRGFLKDTK